MNTNKACFTCVKGSEQSSTQRVQGYKYASIRRSTDSFRQEIYFFFIPHWHVLHMKNECWYFISFKWQQGSILSWILKMIAFVAGS